MNNRQGAKKLYKVHKTWIAAGVAAATLLSASALGGQSVSAATGDQPSVEQLAGMKAAAATAAAAKANAQKHVDTIEGQEANAARQAAAKANAQKHVDTIEAQEAAAVKQAAAAKTAEANAAFRDGQRYGETGAVLPDNSSKSANYQTNFEQGLAAGTATRNQKLAAAKAKAAAQTYTDYKADQAAAAATKAAAAKKAAENAAFNDGQRYGELGAQLPDLTGKTDAYKTAFAQGFDAGAASHVQKLVAAKAKADAANQSYNDYKNDQNATAKANAAAAKKADENAAFRAGQQYGETGAVLPDLAGKTDAYKTAFAQGFNAGAATRAQKLAAAKAKTEAQAENMGKATTPAQDTIDAASKADEANTAFRDGQRYGETGAVLPDLAGKSTNYKDNFAQGFNAGAATRAQKLVAAKAKVEAQAENMGKATTPAQDTIDAASKADEANTAFRDGQRYGETGAVLPDLAGKSTNYKDNFAQGFDAGAATRAQKLASAKDEANTAFRDGQRYGETGAVLPDLADKSTNYKDNFAQGFDAGAATRAQKLAAARAKHGQEVLDAHKKGTDFTDYKKIDQAYADGLAAAKKAAAEATIDDTKTTTTTDDTKADTSTKTPTKTDDTKPVATNLIKKTATTSAAKATAKKAATKATATMPTTGDAVNEGTVVAGVATAMLALFGLAETKKRRA